MPREIPEDLWMPRPEPGPAGLVLDAVTDLIRRPTAVADTVRIGLADARNVASQVSAAVTGVLSAARIAARPAPDSPLNSAIGSQRRFAVARTELEDYRKVRKHRGGTVNDVVLATVAGAIRGWLLSRGEPVTPSTTVRAMVPVSIRGDSDSGQPGNRVSSYLVDLPVGEPNPMVRLSQVSYAMKAHKESGQSVGAEALVALSGFAPPTLHALGARAANSFTRRLFNVVVTNVPGPQFPLYASGARMLEMFPVIPLAAGQAVSIGLTSYDGGRVLRPQRRPGRDARRRGARLPDRGVAGRVGRRIPGRAPALIAAGHRRPPRVRRQVPHGWIAVWHTFSTAGLCSADVLRKGSERWLEGPSRSAGRSSSAVAACSGSHG